MWAPRTNTLSCRWDTGTHPGPSSTAAGTPDRNCGCTSVPQGQWRWRSRSYRWGSRLGRPFWACACHWLWLTWVRCPRLYEAHRAFVSFSQAQKLLRNPLWKAPPSCVQSSSFVSRQHLLTVRLWLTHTWPCVLNSKHYGFVTNKWHILFMGSEEDFPSFIKEQKCFWISSKPKTEHYFSQNETSYIFPIQL